MLPMGNRTGSVRASSIATGKIVSRDQLRILPMLSKFLKEKFLATGEFEKLNAMLVAGGDQQSKKLYDDLSALLYPPQQCSAFYLLLHSREDTRQWLT
jgi:hypothetical protein